MPATISPANLKRQAAANSHPRDAKGHFIKSDSPPPFITTPPATFISVSPRKDPPLVNLQITNPVTYIKHWWKKVVANEGVDLRFRIRPFTAIAIAVSISIVSFGLGRFTLPAENPIVKYIPQLAPSPTPNPWRETAFTGILRSSGSRFYLETAQSEAITLSLPTNINPNKLLGKRILAVGKLNTRNLVLEVTSASDLEILPVQITPIPTIFTTPAPSL